MYMYMYLACVCVCVFPVYLPYQIGRLAAALISLWELVSLTHTHRVTLCQ